MLNINTVVAHGDLPKIDFDMDDSGHYYLKQGDEWIAFDDHMLLALTVILGHQQDRSGFNPYRCECGKPFSTVPR